MANWTEEEDGILHDAVQRYKGKCRKKIAECLPGGTRVQCVHHWQDVLNPDLVKGPWSKEEDYILIELVEKQGKKKRSEIAEHIPGRKGKQCRDRWFHHLNPEIDKGAWKKEEEMVLINAHRVYGNKWSEISKLLPGSVECARPESLIKNHWNWSLKKKLDNYLAGGSALNNPPFTRPALHGNITENGGKFVEEKQNLSIKCLQKENMRSGNDGESCCLDSDLGCYSNFSSRLPSSGKGNNPVRPLPSTCSTIYEVQKSSSSDLYSSLESILKRAAMSYDKMPSIIRKREAQTLQKDISTRDNVVGSLNRQEVTKGDDDDDDEVWTSRQDVIFSPKYRKLEKLKSVEKCLERAFSDA